MIACGLCLMGGCFSQNNDTLTTDSYWPCLRVNTVGEDGTTVFEYNIYGGGANGDVFICRLSLGLPVQSFGEWSPTAGLLNARRSDNTYYNAGCYLGAGNINELMFQYAGAYCQTIGEKYEGVVTISCADGTACAEFHANRTFTLSRQYTLSLDEWRPATIRRNAVTLFYFMRYKNVDTQTTLFVIPMCSPSFSEAIYQREGNVLIEL